MCKKHYEQARTAGGMEPLVRPTPLSRFESSYVVEPSGCWRWTGQIGRGGYGRLVTAYVGKGAKRMQAHRWAALTFIGPIAPGMQVDHLCRNRACVNPAHLEIVTAQENNRRSSSPSSQAGRQTHCIRGHSFSDPAVLRILSDGRRQCRLCRSAIERASKARRKAAQH